MTTTQEIRFRSTARGRRAYRYSTRQLRWFPMPLAEAEVLVATGQAVDLTNTDWI